MELKIKKIKKILPSDCHSQKTPILATQLNTAEKSARNSKTSLSISLYQTLIYKSDN